MVFLINLTGENIKIQGKTIEKSGAIARIKRETIEEMESDGMIFKVVKEKAVIEWKDREMNINEFVKNIREIENYAGEIILIAPADAQILLLKELEDFGTTVVSYEDGELVFKWW